MLSAGMTQRENGGRSDICCYEKVRIWDPKEDNLSVCIWEWCLCLSTHWEWEKSMLLLCLGPLTIWGDIRIHAPWLGCPHCWWKTRCPAFSRKVSLPSMLVKLWRVSWLHKFLRLCTCCKHTTHFGKNRADCVCQACVGMHWEIYPASWTQNWCKSPQTLSFRVLVMQYTQCCGW